MDISRLSDISRERYRRMYYHLVMEGKHNYKGLAIHFNTVAAKSRELGYSIEEYLNIMEGLYRVSGLSFDKVSDIADTVIGDFFKEREIISSPSLAKFKRMYYHLLITGKLTIDEIKDVMFETKQKVNELGYLIEENLSILATLYNQCNLNYNEVSDLHDETVDAYLRFQYFEYLPYEPQPVPLKKMSLNALLFRKEDLKGLPKIHSEFIRKVYHLLEKGVYEYDYLMEILRSDEKEIDAQNANIMTILDIFCKDFVDLDFAQVKDLDVEKAYEGIMHYREKSYVYRKFMSRQNSRAPNRSPKPSNVSDEQGHKLSRIAFHLILSGKYSFHTLIDEIRGQNKQEKADLGKMIEIAQQIYDSSGLDFTDVIDIDRKLIGRFIGSTMSDTYLS